jgi:hypothetical protein
MWDTTSSEKFQRRFKQFEKKRRNELRATAANVTRYLEALRQGTPPKQVAGGFIHAEPHDIVAVDQRGGGKPRGAKLAETRWYMYPDRRTEILHWITLGDKKTQPEDIQYSISYVKELLRHGGKSASDNRS